MKNLSLWLFFFSSRRRHTRYWRDWSSDVCSSDLTRGAPPPSGPGVTGSPDLRHLVTLRHHRVAPRHRRHHLTSSSASSSHHPGIMFPRILGVHDGGAGGLAALERPVDGLGLAELAAGVDRDLHRAAADDVEEVAGDLVEGL